MVYEESYEKFSETERECEVAPYLSLQSTFRQVTLKKCNTLAPKPVLKSVYKINLRLHYSNVLFTQYKLVALVARGRLGPMMCGFGIE